jgi:hypothetical protein
MIAASTTTNESGPRLRMRQSELTSSGTVRVQSRQARKISSARSAGHISAPPWRSGEVQVELERGDDAEAAAAATQGQKRSGSWRASARTWRPSASTISIAVTLWQASP